MRRIHAMVGVAVLGVAALVFCAAPAARGDRVGGSALKTYTVGPYATVVVNENFLANRQASVAVSGNGATSLNLLVFDADGHVMVGSGNKDQKGIHFNVYRTGAFRIEVRNLGSANNTFYMMTS